MSSSYHELSAQDSVSIRGFRAVIVVLPALCVGLLAGCSRYFWRSQADRDVYHLLGHKTADARWDVPRVHIMPDPRSRLFDPYDLDKGPLPLDDAAAGRYMLQVAGKRGYKSWHKFGVRFSIENPNWLDQYGLTPDIIQQVSHNNEPSTAASKVELKNITLTDAVELSNLHSRDYQTEIENVYLQALELTFERFQFNVRYIGLGGREPTVDAQHSSTPHGQNNVDLDSRIGVSQLLPSGGQFIVEMANNTLWLFSGPNQFATTSILSYSLVQPLMFQAGRKIALENLTQAERDSLYAVRDLARFRKVFFTDVVGGNSGFLEILRQAQTVENERANVRRVEEQLEMQMAFSSQVILYYFESLPALPAGIQLVPGDSGKLNVPPTVSGQLEYDPVRKLLSWRGLMSPAQAATLRGLSADAAWQTAVASLIQRRVYEPLAALPAGIEIPPGLAAQLTFSAPEGRLYWRGPMSDVQSRLLIGLSNDVAWLRAVTALSGRLRTIVRTPPILQLQPQLLRSQITLRTVIQTYQNSIDRFKIQLGLPPNIKLSIDTSKLKPFQLIDPRISEMEQRLKDFVLEWARLDENDPAEAELANVIAGLRKLRDAVKPNVVDSLQADLVKVRKVLPRRLKGLSTPAERARLQSDFDRDVDLLKSLIRDYDEATRVLKILERLFGANDTSGPLARRKALMGAVGAFSGAKAYRRQKQAAVKAIATLREGLLQIARNARGIQVGLRVELIKLEPFNLSMKEVTRRALANRLDLKNARAAVMDARRRVEVAANRLEAVLNLRVEGDVRTPTGNRPLDFRARRSNFRVGLGFTAPLDLINERNAYRSAQVAYQRARRAYMALEDQIKLQVRNSWRALDVLQKNFETTRQSVRVSASSYDSAVFRASAPGQQQVGSSGFSLLNALGNFVDSQNGLIRIWVNYERSRLNIYRDMGMMEIDSRGVWTDPYYQQGSRSTTNGRKLPPSSTIKPFGLAPGRRHDIRTGNPRPIIPSKGVRLSHRERIGTNRSSVNTEKAGKVRIAKSSANAGSAGDRRRNRGRRSLRVPNDP